MTLTEAGTLRSVVGPVEYHPTNYVDNGGVVPFSPTYAAPRSGVFHCLINGGKRDILLAHFNGAVYVHEGWVPRWHKLIGPLGLPVAEYDVVLPEDDGRVNFPTQFVATPNGVIITIQGARSYFYDGNAAAPLGFDAAPGAPSPLGPRSGQTPDGAVDLNDEANSTGYAHSGRTNNDVMGDCRLGSIRNDVVDIDSGATKKSNALGGVLQKGEWRAAVQFIDHWGNLSPVSPQSSSVVVQKQDNLTKDRRKDLDERSDRLRVQFAWTDLDTGPPHTIARQLLRTKDQLNSGLPGLFNVPPNATADSQTIATIPNNTQTFYPDNIPDTWLIQPAIDPDPVPLFRLSALAFGRLWVANTAENPGLIRPSEPFFWGTFPKGKEIFPDANGGEVTGLLAVNSGLLVFTDTSTFLITQDDSGQNFKTATLSTTVGCVAPNSAQVTQAGAAIWLGRDGFYGWSGEGVPRAISDDIKDTIMHRVNSGWARAAVAAVDPRMGEYRCWIPVDGSRVNNLCMVFDRNGWGERNDVEASAVCVTRDHRKLMLALGREPINDAASLWVLDHEGLGTRASPTGRVSSIETAWLRNTRSHRAGSPMKATLWLRETGAGTLTLETMRDWREYPKSTESGYPPPLRPDEDVPLIWDVDSVDQDRDDNLRAVDAQRDGLRNHFMRRRPFWTSVDLELPSVETFRLKMSYAGDWEFQALTFDEQDRYAGGAKHTKGVE